MISWLLQRVSGLILLFYLLVHFWIIHYGIEGEITFQKVAERLSSPYWKIFDLTFLPFVLYHALNGVYIVFLDFSFLKKLEKIFKILLYIVGIIAFIFGVRAIILV